MKKWQSEPVTFLWISGYFKSTKFRGRELRCVIFSIFPGEDSFT